MYSMQTQFEEYRTTAEFLFNAEIAKLEDELSAQALRYEHEIMFVISFFKVSVILFINAIVNAFLGTSYRRKTNFMQK